MWTKTSIVNTATNSTICHFNLWTYLRWSFDRIVLDNATVSTGAVLNGATALTRYVWTVVIWLMDVHFGVITLVVTVSLVLISVDLWNVGLIVFLLISFFGLVFLLLQALFGHNLMSTGVQAQTGAARFAWLVLLGSMTSGTANLAGSSLYPLLALRIHLTILLLKLIYQPITGSYRILSTSHHVWIKASGYYLLMLF